MKSITAKISLSIGLATIIFSIFLLYQTYTDSSRRMLAVVEQQVSMALKFDLAIRSYVARYVRPIMYDLVGKDEFIPDTMSTSYVARRIFEDVRTEFPEYIIKFSSDNPRNPANQAGPEELEIINKFNGDPQMQRWSGRITIGGKPYVAQFSARRMKPECLRCHGDPLDAPASLLERYGSQAGFNRPLGEVIGLDTVAIPVALVLGNTWSQASKSFMVAGIGLVFFFLVITVMIRLLITNRISIIGKHFQEAAHKSDDAEIETIDMTGRDEISGLASSYNLLSQKLMQTYASLEAKVQERTREFEQANAELRKQIEDRQSAEDKLRRSEELYRNILAVAPDSITITRVSDGCYLEVNNFFCRLTGYSREEALGRTPFDLRLFADPADRKRFVEKLKADGEVNGLEIRYRRKDGTLVDTLLSARTLHYAGEDCLVAIVTDISERKLAEVEHLQHISFLSSMDRINRALNQTTESDPKMTTVLETVLSIFNCDRAWLLFPCDPHAATWTVPMEFTRPEFRGQGGLEDEMDLTPAMETQFQRALAFEEPFIMDHAAQGKLAASAKECDAQSSLAMAIYPKIGKPWLWGISQCSHNREWTIAEQRLFKAFGNRISDALSTLLLFRNLRQSEAGLKKAQQLAHVGSWEWHVADNRFKMSAETRRIFGIGEVDGRETPRQLLKKIVHPDDRKALARAVEAVAQGQPGDIMNYRIVRPDGSIRWIVAMPPEVVHFGRKGRPEVIIGTVQDITIRKQMEEDKKRLENQLKGAQRVEAIGTLAGGIAHDFNNILAPIIGYTEISMSQLPEDSELRGNLSKVLQASNRAKDLVQQILTFSRQREKEAKPIKCQTIITEALKLLRASIPSTIEIHQRIDPDCGYVMGDATQIHQIIMNLCTNAYHAMEANGGRLWIELAEVHLDERNRNPKVTLLPGCYARLTVSDTGHGMDAAVMARVFDPYFTTKDKNKGTGLGLAVIHGIVKSHGGEITVSSIVGEGATFQVFLPITESVFPEEEVRLAVGNVSGNESILFVDDEELIAEMGRELLERLGYRVTVRTSSIEALRLYQSNPTKFDLVITDMTMPNMTGEELAQELMRQDPELPVLLCSGFSHRMSPERAQALGIKGYLMKPFVINSLAQTVRNVLDRP
jgi:PAS domain S-box-containing protein